MIRQIAVSAVALAAGILWLGACAMPTGTTTSQNENPGILVSGAPAGAVLVVDGIEQGAASRYSDKLALAVLPGRHIVEIRLDGRSLHREEVFVATGAIRTVTVPR